MSLLYKRKGSPFWYVTKTRESTKTINRKLAEEFARKALTEHWRAESLGEQTHTWDDLVSDWLDVKDGASSYDQDRMVIGRFSELLSRREIAALAEIDADVIAAYGKAVKAATCAATANRHYTTLRAMLNRAKGKEWIHAVPRIENYSLPTKEPRWLTMPQFKSILPHLPDWVADMATVAVHTGMRYANVAGLRWDWISGCGNVAIVPAVHTKTGRTYTVPLSSEVKKILANRREVQRQSPDPFAEFVFIGKRMNGRGSNEEVDCAPVPTVRYWWEAATERAGLAGIRWHDLRHTWASLHTQNGTPAQVLKEMGGWASMRMLETYAHLSTAHLVEYADNIGI